MLRDLVLKNRSLRRYDASHAISKETLRELVDLARQSASASNLQPLKYILSWEPAKNDIVFAQLMFARYLKDKGWAGPTPSERPSAYIIVLGDKQISQNFFYDTGIACQTILLGAVEKGLGGCMFGSVNRVDLRKLLAIPDHFEILLVIALGKPGETVLLEKVGDDGNVKYWRDDNSVHHVPKRSLDDVIVG